jgi:outer membrane cobalamin receptor
LKDAPTRTGVWPSRQLKAFISIENLLDKDYQQSFGYPALPLTVRAGMTLLLGGGR